MTVSALPTRSDFNAGTYSTGIQERNIVHLLMASPNGGSSGFLTLIWLIILGVGGYFLIRKFWKKRR
jgi:hypothetical protein